MTWLVLIKPTPRAGYFITEILFLHAEWEYRWSDRSCFALQWSCDEYLWISARDAFAIRRNRAYWNIPSDSWVTFDSPYSLAIIQLKRIFFNVRDWCRNSRGSVEYSVKNENKHYRESFWQIATKSPRILRFLAIFFRASREQVLYRCCLPQWKQEKTGSQLLLFSREVRWS